MLSAVRPRMTGRATARARADRLVMRFPRMRIVKRSYAYRITINIGRKTPHADGCFAKPDREAKPSIREAHSSVTPANAGTTSLGSPGRHARACRPDHG